MIRKVLTLAAFGAAMAGSSFAAVITPYTTAASFNASAVVGGSPTFTENFNTNASLFTTFTLAGGVQTGGFRQIMGGPNYFWRDQIDNNPSQSTTITLQGGGTMTAFGADWDLGINGYAQGLTLTVDFGGGNTQVVTTLSGYSGFYGFTSDTPFVSVIITAGNASAPAFFIEDFNLDNILIEQGSGGGPPPSGVPEPATFGMVGFALAGLGFVAKKLRK